MAEFEEFILSFVLIGEKYESPPMVKPMEGYTFFQENLMYQDAVAKIVVDKAILYRICPCHLFMWKQSAE